MQQGQEEIKKFILNEHDNDSLTSSLTDYKIINFVIDFCRANNVPLHKRSETQNNIRANIVASSILNNEIESFLKEKLKSLVPGDTSTQNKILENFQKVLKEEYIKSGTINRNKLNNILRNQLKNFRVPPKFIGEAIKNFQTKNIILPKVNNIFIKGNSAKKRLGIQTKLSKLLSQISINMGFLSIRGPSGDPMQRFGEPGDSKSTKEHTKSSYHGPGRGHLPRDPDNSRINIDENGNLTLAGQDPTDGPSGQLHESIESATVLININNEIAEEILGNEKLDAIFLQHLRNNIELSNEDIIDSFLEEHKKSIKTKDIKSIKQNLLFQLNNIPSKEQLVSLVKEQYSINTIFPDFKKANKKQKKEYQKSYDELMNNMSKYLVSRYAYRSNKGESCDGLNKTDIKEAIELVRKKIREKHSHILHKMLSQISENDEFRECLNKTCRFQVLSNEDLAKLASTSEPPKGFMKIEYQASPRKGLPKDKIAFAKISGNKLVENDAPPSPTKLCTFIGAGGKAWIQESESLGAVLKNPGYNLLEIDNEGFLCYQDKQELEYQKQHPEYKAKTYSIKLESLYNRETGEESPTYESFSLENYPYLRDESGKENGIYKKLKEKFGENINDALKQAAPVFQQKEKKWSKNYVLQQSWGKW